VLLIGLGAGLLTAMFALVDAVALRKLDVPNPDSLISICAVKDGRETEIPYILFERLEQDLDMVSTLCGTATPACPITYNGSTVMTIAQYAAGDYYGTMQARPLLGRTLAADEKEPVAVISDAFWRRLGEDPGIIGKTIQAGSVPLTVVGVVPGSAHEYWRFVKTDVIVPFETGLLFDNRPRDALFRYGARLTTTARLKKGITLPQVQHWLDAMWTRLLAETIPPGKSLEEWTRAAGTQARVLPANRGLSWIDESLARTTTALFILSGLVLLAMCSNLAGLLLSRGLSRHRDYAVRMALGATRSDVIKHALAEAVVLAIFGGGAVVVLVYWLARLCSELLSLGTPLGILSADYGVRIDGRVAAFALVAALATSVAAQVIAVLRLSRIEIVDSLKAGRTTVSSGCRSRQVMIGMQVAAATVLVSGSLLFIRTLQLLSRVDCGFATENTLVVSITGKLPYSEAGPEYFQELLRRVRAIPSVTSAGLGDRAPMEWNQNANELVTASEGVRVREVKSDSACVWPGFFKALKIPLTAGRDFLDSDRDSIVITRELAQHLFPNGNALGLYVSVGNAPQVVSYRVIGIVDNVRFRSPRQEDARMFFLSCRQAWKVPQTMYAGSLIISARGDPTRLESAVRREIDTMGKHAVYQMISLDALVAKSTWKETILASVGTGFGTFTLVFTCAGIYALINLTSAARRRELGIRLALGASRNVILNLMLKDIVRVAGFGAGVGLVVSLMVVRVYRSFLFGVTDFEPTLSSAALVLVILFAVAAALLPAWRASRLDPGSVLRDGE
jgi:predicted permease